MQIQINAPHTQSPDQFFDLMQHETSETLAQHEGKLTRIEIHLKDLNAHKGGLDKRCVMEARPRGLQPVVAEHDAEREQDAFRGALDKLNRVLQHRFGKLEQRDQR